MAGFYNDVVVGTNVNLSGNGSTLGTILLDGQIIIGSTALNGGGTHCNINTLTAGAGISIINGSGTITIAANGSVLGETITGDTGGALSPTAGNWNILGQQAGTIAVMDTIGTAPSTLRAENRAWLTSLVVDPSSTVGLRGTFTTITLAMAAASSGQTIFVRPGTYTENFTWTAGVDICAFDCDALTPNVTIIGKVTATSAGARSMSGIRLQTNSDNCLAVTGSAATVITLKNCFINCTNNTGILNSSSDGGAIINIFSCNSDTTTTGIALFSMSGAGGIIIKSLLHRNTGGSTTANTCSGTSSGALTCIEGTLGLPLTLSSSASVLLINSILTTLTSSNTSTATLIQCSTGDIVIGAGTVITMSQCTLSSSTTNVISGSGTLIYSDLAFIGSGIGISASTQTSHYVQLGKYKAMGQPAFLATAGTQTDITGDGTTATLTFVTEIFDQDNNFDGTSTFTAPVTGNYLLSTEFILRGMSAASTGGNGNIVTSARSYTFGVQNYFATSELLTGENRLSIGTTTIANMTAGDTALVQLTVSNGTKTVDVIQGSFSGSLIC